MDGDLQTIINNSVSLWTVNFENEVISILSDTETGVKRSRQAYHIRKNFGMTNLAGITKVITKKHSRIMATKENVMTILRDMHLGTGHKGEKKTYKKISEHYANISRHIVSCYIKQCERCTEKLRKKEIGPGVVIKPIIVTELNQRGQIDLVDFQSLPDGNYKFIMHYQEHLTKYNIMAPLTTKRAEEVARGLLKIFLNFGAPHVLQSDNGREFTANIIKELSTLWPELVLVNGRPRHPQSQGSVERSNGTLKNSLVAWMRDHNTSNWSAGLMFAQWSMNTTYHEAIKMEPYKALFGVKPKIGLGTSLPSVFLNNIQTGIDEDDLIKLINEDKDNDSIEMSEEMEAEENFIKLTNEDEDNDSIQISEEMKTEASSKLVGEYIVSTENDLNEIHDFLDIPIEHNTGTDLPRTTHNTDADISPIQHHTDADLADTRIVECDDNIAANEHPANEYRVLASKNLNLQAERMVRRTKRKLKAVEIGTTVNVFVSQFDRGRGDPANLIGVVLETKNDKYRIGTRGGIIDKWLQRNCFEVTSYRVFTREQ